MCGPGENPSPTPTWRSSSRRATSGSSRRTGIRERRIARPDRSDLRLRRRGVGPRGAGESPERRAGGRSSLLHRSPPAPATQTEPSPRPRPGRRSASAWSTAAAYDLSAACAGFCYAVDSAHQYLAAGRYKNVLVIGAETMTRTVDWTDRNTCILFGDGAGRGRPDAAVPLRRGHSVLRDGRRRTRGEQALHSRRRLAPPADPGDSCWRRSSSSTWRAGKSTGSRSR